MLSAPTQPTPATRGRALRWELLAAGIVAVVALFAYTGSARSTKTLGWPWQHFSDGTTAAFRVDILLWSLTCVLTICASIGRTGTRLFPYLGAAIVLLLVRSYGDSAAFPIVLPLEPWLAWLLAAASLGAGALLLGSREGRGRTAGRVLAVAGSLGILVSFALFFEKGGSPLASHLRRDFASVWRDLFGGIERAPDVRGAQWVGWWGTLLPQALTLIAATGGLFLGWLGSVGPASRGVARGVVVCLLARWISLIGVGVWAHRANLLSNDGREALARGLVDMGFATWLLTTAFLVATLRESGETSAASTGVAS